MVTHDCALTVPLLNEHANEQLVGGHNYLTCPTHIIVAINHKRFGCGHLFSVAVLLKCDDVDH